MRTRFALSLAESRLMVDAALTYAHSSDLAVSIAIVDDGGTPILVSRLDEASPASFTTAIEKARSAALTGLPTASLESMLTERPALATLGRVAVKGGLPIIHQGQRVGGIGVSGIRSDQDAEIAEVGLAALAPSVPERA
jgi:glc operon protein GlcG